MGNAILNLQNRLIKFRGENHGLCFTMVDNEGTFVGVKPEINGDCAAAHFETGENGFQGLGIIVLQNRHPITLLNADSPKGIGQPVDTHIELSVAQPFLAMHQCRFFREGAR